jgi:transcriptional regulator with XRE-family HTH domain
MGVTRSVIARLEAGERPLRFSEFMVLARVLKVSPEALLARVLKW